MPLFEVTHVTTAYSSCKSFGKGSESADTRLQTPDSRLQTPDYVPKTLIILYF